MGSAFQVIVTCDTALVVNAERASDPQVQNFIEDLQHRLAMAGGALSADPSGDCANSTESPPLTAPLLAAKGGHPVFESGFGDHVKWEDQNMLEEAKDGPTEMRDAISVDADGHLDGDAEQNDDAATEMAAGMAGSAQEASENEVSFELKVVSPVLSSTGPNLLILGLLCVHVLCCKRCCLDHNACLQKIP
jgi:hypothetical protein